MKNKDKDKDMNELVSDKHTRQTMKNLEKDKEYQEFIKNVMKGLKD